MTVTATNRAVYTEIERALVRARHEKAFRDEVNLDHDSIIKAHEVLRNANRLKKGAETLWRSVSRHHDLLRTMIRVSMHPEIELARTNDVMRLLVLQQTRPPEEVAKIMCLGGQDMFFVRGVDLFTEALTQVCKSGWEVYAGTFVFSLILGKKVREQREVPFRLGLELHQDSTSQAIASADITLTPGAYLEPHWYHDLRGLIRIRHDGRVVPLVPLGTEGCAERLPVFGAMHDQTFKGHRLGAHIALEQLQSSFVSISLKTSLGHIARHGFFLHPISPRLCRL